MTVAAAIAGEVRRRARDRCEYCRMHQSLQGGTFHIEHINPESKGGGSSPGNLALACAGCNLHKSDRVSATDPGSSVTTALFNPRHDVWSEHFVWIGFHLQGKSPIGRATVALLQLNHARRLLIRRAESEFGLFPPSID